MRRARLSIILFTAFILLGCSEEPSEKVAVYRENSEIIGSEKDELIGDVSETIYESIDRSNENAEEIFIVPVEGLGEQVTPPEGRYIISSGAQPGDYPQTGRILVYDEEEEILIDELHDNAYGVGGITVDLNGSHTVHVDGMDQGIITPAETELSNELSAGIWEVGTDIEAGSYEVYPSDYGFGYLHLFDEGQEPRVFEFLNTASDGTVEVELEVGQKLRISGIHFLQFEPTS